MKRFLCALIIITAFAGMSYGASNSELRRMSMFISNFVEVGMTDIDAGNITDSELAYFGIWHNYRNNFKSRIQRCPDKDCPYGSLIIDKKYVAESVKKYFGLDMRHQSAENESMGHYDGRCYHFDGADGETAQARVFESSRRGNVITMKGETYYPDNEDIEGESFTATARPYKYNGKDTWSILTLKTEDADSDSW